MNLYRETNVAKTLERDLGLYSTINISVGAMIGSGIFVLPGLAFKIAGPAAILAYLLAGVVALPAVLSKAEMATAMPEAGGTYLYIDRAMGPLLGTIAGLGAWFSLTFKSAFALVGLGAYLVLFSALSPKIVALGLAILLLVVNIIGVKQSGRLQSVIVTIVVAALLLFIADGITFVDTAKYHPFFPQGRGSLLAATGFVFVSYAGVTKIAAVAEEVENPGRNIPIAMIVSVMAMMLVYAFVVYVIVGVTDPAQLAGTLTPMAVGAEHFLGSSGVILVGIVAVVALISMSNAGLLSASRFPFAMSRDELAPPAIEHINERFHTPVVALLLTGAVLVMLVGFVPVLELAKLASAFKILVFSLVNVALIAFRESDLESYDPEFESPGYPWVQVFGLVAGFALLTQMGVLPLLGAGAIILGGIGWYHLYGRERTEREGAAFDAIRQGIGTQMMAHTEHITAESHGKPVLVVVGPETPRDRERRLLTLAGHVANHRESHVEAVLFEEVPEQVSLSSASTVKTDVDQRFETEISELRETIPTKIDFQEIVSHDARRAVINHGKTMDAGLILGETTSGRVRNELLGYDIDWFMQHAPCDIAFVRDRGLDRIHDVAVLAQRGPHGPLKVAFAGAIAAEAGATVRFVTVVDSEATHEEMAEAESFHAKLDEFCAADTVSEVVQTDDLIEGLRSATESSDLAIVGHDPHTVVHDLLLGDLSDRIANTLDCSVALVHSQMGGSGIRRLVKRVVF